MSARRLAVALGLAALVGASSAPAQQPVDPDAPVPEGHPAMPETPAAQDRVAPAPDLRPGTIAVHVRDGKETPLPDTVVRLGILHNDIAQGDSKSEVTGKTNAEGVATFAGLEIGTAYSYRASVPEGPAVFASDPVRLEPTSGQRVLLHVYPVVRDLRDALVGMRGVVFVQPREDVFHIEANFQVLNIGASAWVPENVRFALPKGAKAFRASDSMSDTRAETTPSGDVTFVGTFSPGQREVGFQFQLDNPHEHTEELHVALPPHVAELRVVAEGARGMTLHVEGFPDAEPMQGEDGSRLLVTGKHLRRGEPALDSIDVALENLPVPSLGRWYAVGIAVALFLLGLAQTLRRRPAAPVVPVTGEDLSEAEDLVLTELVQLERLRKEERIGPRTYEEARVALLDTLARLHTRISPGPA